MASVNVCTFIGRAARDSEVRFTASGQAVANVTIACGEKFKNKAGEYEERTEWVPLVFWGKLAEIVGEYVTKGKEIYVSGRFSTRKFQDKDGKDRYQTEVVCSTMQLLGGKGEGGNKGQGGGGQQGGGYDDIPDFDSSEVPF